jgi:hypothetical protein
MKNKNWYVITDINEFINNTRILVYNSFGSKSNDNQQDMLKEIHPEEQEEFDKVLSYKESKNIISTIVRVQTNKKTQQQRYLINEILLDKIITQLNQRLVSNILSTLVNKGLIETTYDPELNDFVFWCNDSNNNG